MDFVGPFPTSTRGYDMVFTIVDLVSCVVLSPWLVLTQRRMLPSYFLKTGYADMVYLQKLLAIEIVNSLPTFGNRF